MSIISRLERIADSALECSSVISGREVCIPLVDLISVIQKLNAGAGMAKEIAYFLTEEENEVVC